MQDSTAGGGTGDPGTHTESEDHPWQILIPDHPAREDTPEYVESRKVMNEKARTVAGFLYGAPPYQDHHGGGLWLKDDGGWFLVRNVAGIEWSAQFCADPAKVDLLRRNAKRVYAGFPQAVADLGIGDLLDAEITDPDGVAAWTDSICNASVPLRPPDHTGVLPVGSGVHHYPMPIVDILFFKHADFELFVTDSEGQPAAVVPVDRRGSGDGRVRVLYATPQTALARKTRWSHQHQEALVLSDSDPMAKEAFKNQ